MFYDKVSNALARSLTKQSVSELYFIKDDQLIPIRNIWKNEQRPPADAFWRYVTKDWEPDIPLDAKRIKFSRATLVYPEPTDMPLPTQGPLFRVDHVGAITPVQPIDEPYYSHDRKKYIVVMEKMPRDPMWDGVARSFDFRLPK